MRTYTDTNLFPCFGVVNSPLKCSKHFRHTLYRPYGKGNVNAQLLAVIFLHKGISALKMVKCVGGRMSYTVSNVGRKLLPLLSV